MEIEKKNNDPYLKPIIFSGLFIALLSIVCPLGIFLWAAIGGYIGVKLAYKVVNEVISISDSLLIGLFAGIVSGTSLDVLAVISFLSQDNKQTLLRMLKKNWPKDVKPLPDLNEILPTVFLTTSIFILLITIVFAVIGAAVGKYIIGKKKLSDNKS